MLDDKSETPTRDELLSMVRKHSKLIGKTVLDEEETSDVEMDSGFWRDVIDLYFVRGRVSRGRQDDDLIFFVRKMSVPGQKLTENVETNSPYFVRRWASKLDELIGENSEDVDWRRSFYLNLIAHTSFSVTVAICSHQVLQQYQSSQGRPLTPIYKVVKTVYASPSRINFHLDSRKEVETMPAYPDICFAVDDFDSTFDAVVLTDTDHCYCVLLNAHNGAAFPSENMEQSGGGSGISSSETVTSAGEKTNSKVHIEETKGTLQFASRAKRITNCVQVNEVLTDAALLKRQKLEIEELRRKLQGSHAEVLEQEILKLRNEMLKYELEREKLATSLEEERRSHKERDQCIWEQNMKIDHRSNLVSLSNLDESSFQNDVTICLQDGSMDCHSMSQEKGFSTPCYKAAPNVFVAKRSQHLTQSKFSPLPDSVSNFADEDTWMKMNKGFMVDLDSLHTTPARKVQSFPSNEDLLMEKHSQEIQNLQRQLNLVVQERDELKREYAEQVSFNSQLTREVSELQQEVLHIREFPQNLRHIVANCKHIYKDVFSILQNFIPDERSAAAQILLTTSEVGLCLFSNLEFHLPTSMDGMEQSPTTDYMSVQEQCSVLCKRLNSTISKLVLPDASTLKDENTMGSLISTKVKLNTLGGQIAYWKEAIENEVATVKQKYNNVENERDINKKLLEISEGKYQSLERELYLLKEDKEGLVQRISSLSQMLELVTGQKDNAFQDLKTEVRRKKNLEEEIKLFSIAFAGRQRSLNSFHDDFKAILDTMKSSLSKSH